MKAVYINGIGSVSIQYQDIFDFNLGSISDLSDVNYAKHPSYKEMIPAAMIRRMAQGVKMGIYASQTALNDAEIEFPDAIITGTGMGCLQDSEKFLRAIIENEEEFLTPTSFIQSTHNTVGSQIALRLGCKGYNFTYVNGANSFENALLDAKLQIENDEENNILVGGIDEISDYTLSLLKKIEVVKKETSEIDFKNPTSVGVPFGEGANFLALSSEKKSNSYAEICDVFVQNKIDLTDLKPTVLSFLEANAIDLNAIDVLVLGRNADVNFNEYYSEIEQMFEDKSQVYYKHLSAEFDTASAFGVLVAAKVLNKQQIPNEILWNNVQIAQTNYVLCYNQYRGKDHSLVLLKRC
ncbi:beta-ketoacyl synthase chain length factor [Flavobacterium sp. I3-2]|uniref:beta-ketoacyl synthase chain length factor n=1 Tax=Flavobacterium sp. I3-2 TaxID=2748319 RepID=UPI0015A75A90|nr:beta-ketoacyl synthase chain length factor [Flavobacterium sp. I3-2]